MDFTSSPHRRLNILTGEWIKVSPHRTQRPWNGQVESAGRDKLPQYDSGCYLCPGNGRAGGKKNPDYSSTFVFDNDFMAILPDTSPFDYEEGLLKATAERGICRVICFSPRHDLTLALMDEADIRGVIDVWVEQYLELGKLDYINHVQIFENRGAVMGCSNPHPHGQVWAEEKIPYLPSLEFKHQKEHLDKTGRCLLCDYLEQERSTGDRIVFETGSFTVLVPFWAVWPYEVMILPRRHMSSIDEMNHAERADLASVIKRLGIRYDNLFSTSFPYSMGIHQKPTDGAEYPETHFHFHYYPPLLRSAEVKKFMVGYEMLAMAQRDITAEGAAEILRGLSEIHYTGVEND